MFGLEDHWIQISVVEGGGFQNGTLADMGASGEVWPVQSKVESLLLVITSVNWIFTAEVYKASMDLPMSICNLTKNYVKSLISRVN